MFWFFGHESYKILAPRPGIKPTPPALEGEILTLDCQGSLQSSQWSSLIGWCYYRHFIFFFIAQYIFIELILQCKVFKHYEYQAVLLKV